MRKSGREERKKKGERSEKEEEIENGRKSMRVWLRW